ncbi:MAG: ABC transporter ATP-binding protein [Chloroherpetonaceae bacterium]|nr:ABC transporter ATP-binding protein [Chloroherpetonaceae bacterium]
MSSLPLIQVDSVSKVYKAGTADPVYAIRDISFLVERGSFISIVGKSGSGKSTLMNLIGGLDTPTSGTIIVNGKKISEMSRDELSLYRRREVGIVFQFFNLVPNLTASENASLPLFFDGVSEKERMNRADNVLELVKLGHRKGHLPTELSGGEQQRTAIARSLIHNPQFILADEPTGNLDSKTAEEIITVLTDLNSKGITIFMITHDLSLAESISSRILTLKDGEILSDKELETLRN